MDSKQFEVQCRAGEKARKWRETMNDREFTDGAYQKVTERLQDLLSSLDPEQEPVKVVLLTAYIERWHALCHAGVDGASSQCIDEFNELRPWITLTSEITPEIAWNSEMPKILQDAGASFAEVYFRIEEARKADTGRRREALLAIEALEQNLAGKSYQEIADSMDNTMISNPRERVRKLIKSVQPTYEKYLRK